MTIAVTPGLGTVLAIKVSSTYHDVGQMTTFSMSGWTMGTVETTNLISTTKTYRTTLTDGGEYSCDIFFDPNDTYHALLPTKLAAGTLEDFQITLADANNATIQFFAFVTGFELTGMEPEGNVTANVKFKVNGNPTITAGTP